MKAPLRNVLFGQLRQRDDGEHDVMRSLAELDGFGQRLIGGLCVAIHGVREARIQDDDAV